MTVFHALWIGPRLSLVERTCLASFVHFGHDLQLHCYDEVQGVPAGVRVVDASRTVPRAFVRPNRGGRGKGSFAAFSDIFRYACLAEHGGVYVDCDVVCLRREFPTGDFVVGRQDDGSLCGAVLGLARGSAEAKHLLFEALSIGVDRVRWSQIGPQLVTRIVDLYQRQSEVLGPTAFYAVQFQDYVDFVLPGACGRVVQRIADSPACHLWNEKFRRAGWNKDVLPPPGSWLRERITALVPDAGAAGEYRVVLEDADGAVFAGPAGAVDLPRLDPDWRRTLAIRFRRAWARQR